MVCQHHDHVHDPAETSTPVCNPHRSPVQHYSNNYWTLYVFLAPCWSACWCSDTTATTHQSPRPLITEHFTCSLHPAGVHHLDHTSTTPWRTRQYHEVLCINCFRHIFYCSWTDSVEPLQYFRCNIPLTYQMNLTKLPSWKKMYTSNNLMQ